MNAIHAYLETMFSPYPQTPRMLEAKTELQAMMEDAYQGFVAKGASHNEAVGRVITDFGNLDELAPVLGIAGEISPQLGPETSPGTPNTAASSTAAQTITQAYASGLRRPFRIQLTNHRIGSRTPGANAQRRQRIRLVDTPQPVAQHQLTTGNKRAAVITHPQLDDAALAQTAHQLQVDRRPARSHCRWRFGRPPPRCRRGW